MIVVAIIGIQFLIVQVQAGKNLVFLEDEIRNHSFLRVPAQVEVAKLLKASDEKRKLRLKCCSRLPFVKRLEKRILLGIGDALGIEPLGKNIRKRALADSNGTFYSNVAGQIEELG